MTVILLLAYPCFAQTEFKLQAGPFTVVHGVGDERTAQHTLDVLQDAARDYGQHLPVGDAPVQVKVCRSVDEFRAVAGSYGKAMVGGVAHGAAGIIVLKSPRLLPPESDYAGMVRHELIHVLLARNTDEANVPRWLNEGIAMIVSREMRWGGPLQIGRMYVYGRLIPYPDLDMAFAPLGDEQTFGDAYAQAWSMTKWLQDRMGADAFWQLVAAMKQTPFESALKQQAGLTPAQLYDGWKRSLWYWALILAAVTGLSSFQIMALLVVIAWWRKRRKGQELLEQWDEEDGVTSDDPEEYYENEYTDEDEDEDERW